MTLKSKFGISQSVMRIEDKRLLKGEGRYVDDICPKDAYFVSFLRSPIAHGKIIEVDVSEALLLKEVVAIYTSKNLENKLLNSMSFSVIKNKNGEKAASPIRPILADKKVRFVGEAIAAVVARTKKDSLDAIELINLNIKELSPHMDLKTGGEDIHPEAYMNEAFSWEFGNRKKVNLAFKNALHVVGLDLIDNRVCANPIETRGCFAQMEGQRLHFCFSGQGVWNMKKSLARNLGIKKSDIRVTNPDIGGGFGMKSFDYPEYFIVAMAAKELNKSVRWQAERGESLLADNGARDLVTNAEAAFDKNYKLLALRIKSTSNLGAYNSSNGQLIQTELALKVLTGAYDVKNILFEVTGVFTNTSPVDAYRGAGRPEAIYILERLMDYSARVLNINALELRRKNFITPDRLPFKTASGEIYDVGNFSKLLTSAEIKANINSFESRKRESLRNGKLRGIGLCYYIEAILGEHKETTTIEFTENGYFNLYVGTQSNGQGHETVFTQILHQKTGIPFEKINIIQGDSDLIPRGGGTGGSRSVTMQGNSINSTSDILIRKLKKFAEKELSALPSQIEFEDGYFLVSETNRKTHIMDLALKLNQAGHADSLKITHENAVSGRSYPYGVHFAEVEVDKETGLTQCVKYTVVDDFGVLMNPMLVEGQVHGGVAQGIGQALKENVVFDATGQLLSGSFMDYSMPRATDIPSISFHTELIPSTANEIGMKGCGEAGTVGALAAVTNACLDAVWNIGVRKIDMPVTPFSMWNYIKDAEANQKGETCL